MSNAGNELDDDLYIEEKYIMVTPSPKPKKRKTSCTRNLDNLLFYLSMYVKMVIFYSLIYAIYAGIINTCPYMHDVFWATN